MKRIEKMLQVLATNRVKSGVFGGGETRVYGGILLNNLLRSFSKRGDYDGLTAKVNFHLGEIEVTTWFESHHNGDIHDVQVEKLPVRLAKEVEKEITSAFMLKMNDDINEERRREMNTEAEKRAEFILREREED